MKMPEPIIDPTTIMVASSGPSRRTRWRSVSRGGAFTERVVAGIVDPGREKMRIGVL
jgi:hypothetical protein